MRVRLLSVGRPRDEPAAALHDRYAERIRRFGIRYECEWVPEVKPGGRFSDGHVREREARLLLERLTDRERLVALDRHGAALVSEQLARRLEQWLQPSATFVVGGPLGLHETLLERAAHRWSLSSATLPHELARVLVAEQLYRALTILRGVPYHK